MNRSVTAALAHGVMLAMRKTTIEFLQDPFDLLCSDLGSLKLATAVAGSAAVPITLSPITLRNHAAPCPRAGYIDLYGLFGNLATRGPLESVALRGSLQAADLEPELQGLGQLPTALSLPPADVRRLVEAGRRVFHRSPELARLLADLKSGE